MANHIVRQGECLSGIARQYGFADYHAIYDHPANAQLKKLRGNPNVLHPGDQLFVPEKGEREEPGATDQRHPFVVRRARVFLEIAVHFDDQPVADAVYILTVGGKTFQGKTDGAGVLKQEIDPSEELGHLHVVEPALDWDLNIGHVDPLSEISGVQARLNNLDHPCGIVDGIMGPRTRAALRQFKLRHGLKPSGAIDGAALAALRERHDGA